MTDPLIERATVPSTPLHGALPGARASIRRTASDLLAVRDEQLERDWRWRPDDPSDIELRYAFYAIHEILERAIGTIEVARSEAPDGDLLLGIAVPAIGAMTAARWDLHGVLAGFPPESWDADPGGGGSGPAFLSGAPLAQMSVVEAVFRHDLSISGSRA